MLGSSACGRGSTEPPVVGNARASSALVFAPDRLYGYAVELTSEVGYGAGASLSFHLRGRLDLQRALATPTAVTLAATLADLRFLGASPDSEREFAALAAELRRGFEVALENGKIRDLRGSGASSPFATNIIRSVAAALELPPRPDRSAAPWTVETADAAGKYMLEVSAAAEPGRYRKRKLRYLQAAVDRDPRAVAVSLDLVPRVLSSDGEIELSKGVLRGSRYEETLETDLGQGGSVRAHNRVTLNFLESHSAGPLLTRATTSLEAGEPRAVKVDRAAMDAAKVGGMSFDDAVATLADREPGLLVQAGQSTTSHAGDDPARDRRLLDHNQAFSALSAMLRTDPALIERAVVLIRRGRTTAKLVLDALVAADTTASHAAVIALADDRRLSPALRASAAQGLARLGTPTADTLDALLRMARRGEHALAALYGLGTEARHLKEQGNVELAHRAVVALIAALEGARSDEARVHALRGMANSGMAECLPAVEPMLVNGSELVRAAAVEALRLMDGPGVDSLIARRLAEETKGLALRAALTAARARRPSAELEAAVAAVATGALDDHSRYEAVGVLARWLPEQPSLREVLLRVAEGDSIDTIRSAARSAL